MGEVMKFTKKLISGFLVSALIILGSIGAFGATETGLKTIQAYLSQSKIMIQGQAVKDSKGQALNTIKYNGSEYIPVSALEKLNIPVNFGTDKNMYIDSTETKFKVNSSKFIAKTKSEYMLFTKSPLELKFDDVQYSYGFVTSVNYRSRGGVSLDSLDGADDYAPHSLVSDSIISEIEATFLLDKNFTIERHNTPITDLTLIGYTKNADGVTVVLSVPITAGVPQKIVVPVDSNNISFKVIPTSSDNLLSFTSLKLYILDPVFTK